MNIIDEVAGMIPSVNEEEGAIITGESAAAFFTGALERIYILILFCIM